MSDRAPRTVERQLPTEESKDLLTLVRDIVEREIVPRASEEEEAGHFPRETFSLRHRRRQPPARVLEHHDVTPVHV
ncbi:acyl-CoA dehydrogenase family protein, partial [Streptomyces niveus]